MRQLLRDATWVTASHGIVAVTMIAVQVLLARSLPPAVFGAFLVAQAFVAIAEATLISRANEVSTYWLGRYWSTDYGLARAYALHLVRREWFWNSTVAATLILLSPLLARGLEIDAWLIACLALSLPLNASFGVSKTMFVVASHLRQQAILDISYGVINVVLTAVLLPLAGVKGYVAGYLCLMLFRTVAAARWTRTFWPAGHLKVAPQKPPELSLSAYSIVRNVSVNVSQQADVILLGIFASKDMVAVYKVARTIANLPLRLSAPVWAVLRPRVMTRLRADDLHGVRRILTRPALLLLPLGLVALPIVWLFIDDLLRLLYGAHYEQSADMTMFLLAGVWVLFGLTGWLSFIAVITSNKFLATSLFAAQAIAVLIAGLVARGSALLLAALVGSFMVLIAVLAWLALYSSGRGRFSLLRL